MSSEGRSQSINEEKIQTENTEGQKRQTERLDGQTEQKKQTERQTEKADIQKEKTNIQADKLTIDRDLEGRICASLYITIENKIDNIFLSGENQCHITRVKKVLFLPCLSYETKNSFVVVGGWWLVVVVKVTLVSVLVYFFKDQRSKLTKSLTIIEISINNQICTNNHKFFVNALLFFL